MYKEEPMSLLFSQASQLSPLGDGLFSFQNTETWAQGRTAFGGFVVGVALKAILTQLPADRSLRTLNTTFVAPVRVGEAQVQVQVLRQGKSLTHVEARVLQGDQVCTVILGSFGSDHDNFIPIETPHAPEVPAPETLEDMPFLEGIVPNFLQNVRIRWANEGFPFSGAKEAKCFGWCRVVDDQPLQLPGLVALLDAWPPPVIAKATSPVPASSVSWILNLFLEVPPEGFSTERWWLYRSESIVTKGGYVDCAAHIWDDNGRLIALSRQLAVEFS